MSDKLESSIRGQQPHSTQIIAINGASPQGSTSFKGGIQPQQPTETAHVGSNKPPASK